MLGPGLLSLIGRDHEAVKETMTDVLDPPMSENDGRGEAPQAPT